MAKRSLRRRSTTRPEPAAHPTASRRKRAEARDADAGEPDAAESEATEDAEAEEKPGRLARIGASWKTVSGVVATVGTAVGVLATLGLVGGGGGSAGAEAAIASGVAKTADASTFRLRYTTTTTPRSDPGGKSTIVGDGEFDYRAGRGRMEFDLSRSAGNEALSSVIVVFNGPTFYFRETRPRPGGFEFKPETPWARVTFAEVQRDPTLAPPGVSSDPTKGIKGLGDDASGIRKVGTEPGPGVVWTHYRGQRDPDAGGPARPTTIDVWIDDDGFVRKIETTTTGAVETVQTRTELDEFGVKVDVELPPSKRVFDFASVNE